MSFALSVTQQAPSCSEHDLVAAVRRGSDRAFEELYSRYRGRITGYILGMVGDHGRAEDIAQEVFIAALRRLRDTERPIAFKPWIYEIAKNACIDEFRRARRAQEVSLETEGERSAGQGDLMSSVPTPDAAIENKQSLNDLRGAFGSLSENHHKVIVMREFEGLSYRQIGERLGMTRPVVESTLFRARRRLSEEYDELVSGRRCEHVQTMIESTDERALRKLGIRERRQLARHLSHCQPCRRHARMSGLDDSLFQAPTLIGKIAALLPFPWLRWRASRAEDESVVSPGSHSIFGLQSLQTLARIADPAAPSVGFGRAAAAVAALALAGLGVSAATKQSGHIAATHRAAVRTHGSGAAPAAARTVSLGSRSAPPVRVHGRPVARASTGTGKPGGMPGASGTSTATSHSGAPSAPGGSTATTAGQQASNVLPGPASSAGSSASGALPSTPSAPAPLPKLPNALRPANPKLGQPSAPSVVDPSKLVLSVPDPSSSQTPQVPQVSAPVAPKVTIPPARQATVPDPGHLLQP